MKKNTTKGLESLKKLEKKKVDLSTINGNGNGYGLFAQWVADNQDNFTSAGTYTDTVGGVTCTTTCSADYQDSTSVYYQNGQMNCNP